MQRQICKPLDIHMIADKHNFTPSPFWGQLSSVIPLTIFFFIAVLPTSILVAQDEGGTEIFWGEEDEDLGDLEGIEFEDDSEEDFGGEFGDEEDLFEEDVSEDFGEEEFFDEGEDEFADAFEDEPAEEDLTAIADRMGYTINLSGSSPGFVGHQLNTYNSGVDFRASFEFPMLLEIGPMRFRLGAEVGTFKFKNYKPIGGEYSGAHITGIISFPAGPGNVKLGGGMIGSGFGVIAENSYGLTLGNTLDLRVGVRSTTAFGIKDSAKNNLGTVSWLDGLIIFGVTI